MFRAVGNFSYTGGHIWYNHAMVLNTDGQTIDPDCCLTLCANWKIWMDVFSSIVYWTEFPVI